jgi:hypothetical protein
VDGVSTLGDLVRDALAAYEGLESLAEDIEEEWTYVTDVAAAWRVRIEALIDERGSEPVTGLEAAAIGRAIDEIGRIGDPHRAIDWLSTFPQIVLVVLGGHA